MSFKRIMRLVVGSTTAIVIGFVVAPAAATPNPHPPHFEAVGTTCSTVVFAGGNQSDMTIEVVRGPVKKTWTPPLTPSWELEVTGLKPGLYRFALGDLRSTAVVTSCKRGLAIDVWAQEDCKNNRLGFLVGNIGRKTIDRESIEASREGPGLELVRTRPLASGKLVRLFVPAVEDDRPVSFLVVAHRGKQVVYEELLVMPPKC